MTGLLKDDRLDRLADERNVAQFVSFAPGTPARVRHARIHGADGTAETGALMRLLLARSASGTVNVRSFTPERPDGNPFHYGVRSADDGLAVVSRLAADGLYTIVNETVDIDDGGVSGVVMGGVAEFAPHDTPRCVEKPGTAALAVADAIRLFETVYGLTPDIDFKRSQRAEFSVHPEPVGYRRTPTLVWQLDDVTDMPLEVELRWPNRFSQHVGDKTFGLLVAHLHGLPVPRTTVVARDLAPFAFGDETGSPLTWLRTAPRVPQPGRFTTLRGWADPFALLAREDPGDQIAAVLHQQSVDATFSGAATIAPGVPLLVEGVEGSGAEFMSGTRSPEKLPARVYRDVEALAGQVVEAVGPARFEWVRDKRRVWVVQLHQDPRAVPGPVIVDGDARSWLRFDPSEGLDRLRRLIDRASVESAGISVTAPVGVTSHVGELLRAADVPSKYAGP